MQQYRGIAVQRLSDGSIFNVVVKEANGHVVNFTTEDYIAREIQPAIDTLPDKNP